MEKNLKSSATFFRFLLVGIGNTLVGLSCIYIAMYFLHFDLVKANALGYLTGFLLGFFLNKTWTFNNNDYLIYSLTRYFLVLALAYLVNLKTVMYLDSHYRLNPYLIQALGIVPYTIIGFLGSRYFAFPVKKQVALPSKNNTEKKYLNEKPITFRAIELGIVIPCYNEEDVLMETTRQLTNLLQELINEGIITLTSRIYFVDDGSHDNSWQMIESLSHSHECIHGMKLSHNQGHQNALLAGLLTAEGEAIISLDADLQDDLATIKEMIRNYVAGYQIVYGVRDSRKTDTFFKSFTAKTYYALLNRIGVEIIYNHADYRLMSRQAIEALREFGEVNLFLRAIIPQLGFSYTIVYYDRNERFAGESKYPLSKMLSLAWQGITSFSVVPLRFITILGLIVSLISFLITAWVIGIRLFTNFAIPGWASTVLPIYFLGGVQLLCLGIIGEYLGKIYAETKHRPRYIIEKII